MNLHKYKQALEIDPKDKNASIKKKEALEKLKKNLQQLFQKINKNSYFIPDYNNYNNSFEKIVKHFLYSFSRTRYV